MNKILLVGNGFTSCLISDYKNKKMMRKIKDRVPELFIKADRLFDPFRMEVDSVQYSAISWGYAGEGFCGESDFEGPITDRSYNEKLTLHINEQLKKLGFINVDEISSTYFQEYGLIFETQWEEISNVESLLKIIAIFRQNGSFSEDDEIKLKQEADYIYFNDGRCGREALDESRVKVDQLMKWLNQYKMIFTTNYDVVIDELLQTNEIKHLHGGFCYKKNDKFKRAKT